MTSRAVRILFFMRSNIYARNFESTLRLMAERGHSVHVVAETHEHLDPTDLLGRLCREYPGITHGRPPAPDSPRWIQLGLELRKGLDYLRYFGPEYRHAPKLRMRAELKLPVFASSAAWRRLVRTPAGRGMLERLLRAADRALPPDSAITAFIREKRPDLVVVTPLVEPGSPQSAYLRSARSLGIPTALCVFSWDNLTNKGLIHDPLDLLTVWNEPMKHEAVTLHGVPADRVVVTGAVAYDHWFTWTPREDRAAFCARVGLDPGQPYLLYLCSSRFIARDEVPFVSRWVDAIRSRSDLLRRTGVLVRPHPQNAGRWRDADLSALRNVVVWPREGANPADGDSRAEYFDSMYHSAGVVGVNTSAQIESAIIGRAVHTWLAPEFRDTQDGTLHFKHLREVSGGVLHLASDLEQHVEHLEAAVREPDGSRRSRAFVEAFVRPYGIDTPAAPRLVEALETAAGRPSRRDRGAWWAPLARPVLTRALRPVENALRAVDEQTRGRKHTRGRQKSADTSGRARTADATATTPVGGRDRGTTVHDAGPDVPAIPPDAFAQYLEVRERVRGFRAADLPADALTEAERRIRDELGALWDATPAMVAALRRYGAAITGVSASDYNGAGGHDLRERLTRDLRRLLAKGDKALWIDEPDVCGGFGFNGLAQLYNEDTLRFFRVISLLQDAELLTDFRRSGGRRTVWEIGAGWGGFAHHFTALCPDVTYLMTASSDSALLSGAYLKALHPGARFRFYDPARPAEFWQNWHLADFAFAPEEVVAGMPLPGLDLVVDLGALVRMKGERARVHVQKAHDLGCRYLFSHGGVPIRWILDRFYWRHPVSEPAYVAKRLAVRTGDSTSEPAPYFLGWRRLHV